MKLKRFSLICGVAILILTIGLLGVAYAKSLYLASEHHQKLFDAWNINPDGTITKQATYGLQYATDPAGIAIHNDSKIIFITSEMSGGVEIVDPVTLTYLEVSNGPTNLAGIDVDEANDIVYAVKRETNDLYIFKWDRVAKSLTQESKIDLPGCSGAYGLALDEIRGTLWVADTAAGGIPWDQDTFEVTGLAASPVDIGVNSPGFDVLIYLLDSIGNTIRYSTHLSNVIPDNGVVRFRVVSFGGGTGTYYAGVIKRQNEKNI